MMKPYYALNSTTELEQVSEMEILHSGLGVLLKGLSFQVEQERKQTALRISRQYRMIAEHPELPEEGIRPIYRTLAAYWHFRAATFSTLSN